MPTTSFIPTAKAIYYCMLNSEALLCKSNTQYKFCKHYIENDFHTHG